MKGIYKIYLSLFAVASILFSMACTEDIDELSGTWELVFISNSGCDDPTDNILFDLSENNCVNELGVEICIDGSFTFEESGAFTFTINTSSPGFQGITFSENGTYMLSGKTITLCEAGETACESGNYTISGNELTISSSDPEDGCDSIIRLKK